MSLILEALKKSEQQRRLGEAPTFGSPVLSSRRRRSSLPLFVALIAVALGVGWWLLRTSPDATSDARVANRASTPSGAAVEATLPKSARPAGRVQQRIPRATAPVTAVPAPTAPASRAPAAPRGPVLDHPGSVVPLPPASPAIGGPKATVATAPARKPAPVAAAPAPAPARSMAPGTTAASPKRPARAPAPLPATPARNTPSAVVVPSAPAAAIAPAAVPAPTKNAAPAAPALPLVWELPYATRKDLPALALTLHVYAPDPKQRFVVIDGERHVEGDDLGDDLSLREIRPDGVVLVFKGQAFVYPRDGR